MLEGGLLEDAPRSKFELQFSYPHVEGVRTQCVRPQILQGEHLVLYGRQMWKIHLASSFGRRNSPRHGQILHHGFDISKAANEVRRAFRIQNIGFVFQDFPLVPYLSALENTMLAYRIHSQLQLTDAVQVKAKHLLGQLGLEDKVLRLPESLSQGERQRVAIARALRLIHR